MEALRTDSKHDGRCDNPVVPPEKVTDPYSQPNTTPDKAVSAREESGPAWLHTRRGTYPPVEALEEPRDPCRQWRGTLMFRPQTQMRIVAMAATADEFQGGPRDSRGDWTSLRPHERVHEVPIVIQMNPSPTREEPGDSPLK